ncbi:MAG: hypothetical protein KDA89_01020, partial [Planctomycetaceae bacterium]|nr:hypothetical protein [Planctomycetaceae bacterium]
IIVQVDGRVVSTVEDVRTTVSELPLRVQRTINVIRNGELISLGIRIHAGRWEAKGVASLAAVGRFSVFGLDGANRLTALDRATGRSKGTVPVIGYTHHHHNSATDYIYLVTSSGGIACLREIGPTVPLPELSVVSRFATVTSVAVKPGDALVADSTDVCEVELPDGNSQTVSTSEKGVIRKLLIQPGLRIEVGQPLLQLADDSFAVYHQRPDQRPIDVPLTQPGQ